MNVKILLAINAKDTPEDTLLSEMEFYWEDILEKYYSDDFMTFDQFRNFFHFVCGFVRQYKQTPNHNKDIANGMDATCEMLANAYVVYDNLTRVGSDDAYDLASKLWT